LKYNNYYLGGIAIFNFLLGTIKSGQVGTGVIKNSLLFTLSGMKRENSEGKHMNKLLKTVALAGSLGLATAAFTTDANAWWGPWGGGPWNGLGNGWGDGDFSMNFSGRGSGYGRGYGYGYPYYGGYGPYGYPGWGGYPGYGYAPYGYGYPPVVPPAPAPAAPKKDSK
jgi:hypothetical protein